MVANLMGQIAKFFSGGKSGTKALLEAYAKFGKEAVNNYFKNRSLYIPAKSACELKKIGNKVLKDMSVELKNID